MKYVQFGFDCCFVGDFYKLYLFLLKTENVTSMED